MDQLLTGKAKYSSIFNYPTLSWADIGAIGWLVDGAAIMNQIPLCRCSFGPYARAMIRICKEESFHQRQGYEIMVTLCRGGTPEQKADGAGRAQPLLVAGADDVRALRQGEPALRRHHEVEDQALLQRRPAPEVHRCDRAAGPLPRASRFPDPELKLDEKTGHWRFGEIDWSEFKRVLAGDGPCNRQRMQVSTRGARGRRLGARGGAGARPEARRAGGGGKDRSGVETMITQPAGTHLAQLNVGHIRYATDDPAHGRVHGRAGRRQRAGRAQPGFVWRLKDDASNNATNILVSADPHFLVNMSVWETAEQLEHFVWNTVHKRIYQKKGNWFAPMATPHFVMWWIPAGHTPTPAGGPGASRAI